MAGVNKWPDCPKCRHRVVVLYEVHEVIIVWQPDNTRQELPPSKSHVRGLCRNCGHEWRLHGVHSIDERWLILPKGYVTCPVCKGRFRQTKSGQPRLHRLDELICHGVYAETKGNVIGGHWLQVKHINNPSRLLINGIVRYILRHERRNESPKNQ